MSKTHFLYFMSLVFLFCGSCKKDNDAFDNLVGEVVDSNVSFGAVFFAQTHVQQPNDEMFKLVSNRAVLIKVNILSVNDKDISAVKATLTLNGNSETISLEPPALALEPINPDPGKIQHSFNDSFTAVIPKEWVKPGLSITINADEIIEELGEINIGAPNKMILNMFDVSFFSETSGDYPQGWKEELESKLPVSEIELRRLPSIVFPELIMAPRNGTAIAARVSSKDQYTEITGLSFDGEQSTAQKWMNALKSAAGIRGQYALFYVNIYGVPSGGQAGGYGGVGNGNSIGILHHELGHAQSLPHWGNKENYPYRKTMHGIPAPEVYNDVHVGPTWAFDMPTMTFIPPTVQDNAVGGVASTYKKDPMQGGGTGDQEEGFLMRHFSDYSMNQARNYIEGHIVVSGDGGATYNKWDDTAKQYSKAVENNGVQYAVELNMEVISVMAAASAVTPQATMVYPPIGPYLSGLTQTFDPRIETDRNRANEVYCPDGGCDMSLRITQGGQIKVYMLALELDSTADPLDAKSLNTRAVNLRASDGAVSMVELLSTPNAEVNGIPQNVSILDVWEN